MGHRRRTRSVALMGATLLLGAIAASAVAGTQGSSGQYSHTQLTGRAVLKAATFRDGSAPSGAYLSASDRTNAANNGVPIAAAPASAFANQPVQGFSAVIPAAGGDWWALTDNGFGARANSVDAELRVNKVKVTFAPGGTATPGTAEVLGGFGLSDPGGFVPWKIICDSSVGSALPDFDFNKLPSTPPALCGSKSLRKLTGFDFDPESIQVGADGTFWIGEEFGPYLLHVNGNGELLQAPVALAGAKSPQNPTLDVANGEAPTINSSKGFEGLGISPARQTLYALLEGPVGTDDQRDLRINEFDIRSGQYTGTFWKVRLELRGTKVNLAALKRGDGVTPAYPGSTPPPAGFNAIGELTMVNANQAILIERDNGGDSPNVARFKKLFMLTLKGNEGGYVDKTMMADLMAIPDPDNLAGQPAASFNGYFSFPFITIESVFPINDHTLLLVNDNNFPFSNGRSFNSGGPLAADDNEFITLGFDQKWYLDPEVLNVPAAPIVTGASPTSDYTVGLVGDYNYGCDLNVASLTGFVQGTTVPKCSGPLADDLPTQTGIQVPGRSKSNLMIADINRAGVAFSIHDGDTKSGSTECRESSSDATLAQFNGQPWNGAPNPGYDNPIVYTPGDNEWTDCHRFLAAGGASVAAQQSSPIQNLAMLRRKFFVAPVSQGKVTMAVTPQSQYYPENVRWMRGPVMFMTVNQPGSNNNFCSPNQNTTVCDQNNEARDRNGANIAWIEDTFQVAKEEGVKALVMVSQGNPNFERNAALDLPTYDMNGFNEFLDTVRRETKRFSGQVVYVHGDSHSVLFDHPLSDGGVPLANFTRVETAGKEDAHWVKMTVYGRGQTLLSFEPQIVAANLGNNPNGLPWNVKQLPTKLDLPRLG